MAMEVAQPGNGPNRQERLGKGPCIVTTQPEKRAVEYEKRPDKESMWGARKLLQVPGILPSQALCKTPGTLPSLPSKRELITSRRGHPKGYKRSYPLLLVSLQGSAK
jgi:hypothetical protein